MDFIKGFDVSSLPETERCGGRFYDNGAEGDALEILKAHGGNWLRLRLWNDPRDANGNPYGAGDCDLPAVLALARRGRALGYKWLLDLHYSDFWADPQKQYPPKAWANFGPAELEAAVYRFTCEVLDACAAAGLSPDMVQAGNEITNGLLWPTGKIWDNLFRYVKAGVRAVREKLPGIPVMIHLDNGGNKPLYRDWFDRAVATGVDFDVIGLSYYPFWHGSLDGLSANMNDVALRYGRDLVVVETSMGFTLEDYAPWEGLAGKPRKGPAAKPELVAKVPFPMTPGGQADFTRALLDVIDHVPEGRGRGLFWWEPACIPVPGSGWAEEPGWVYVREKGPVGNEWANQALFDFNGNALPALAVIGEHPAPLPG